MKPSCHSWRKGAASGTLAVNVADREQLLTREEAAAFLKVPPQTLADWASRGSPAIPYFRVGRLARYRVGDLLDYLDSTKTTCA